MQTAVRQESWEKLWGQLVARAWSDEELKQRLIDDPETVLREHDIDVPPGVDVKIVEDTDTVRHLVLPASPSEELSDEDLSCSAGYDSFSGFSFSGGDCRRCGCGRCGCGCDAHS